jgi:thioesterase domain-containing protein
MLTILGADMGVDARRLASPRFLSAPTMATLREAILEPQRTGVLSVVLQEHGKGPPFLCFPGATLDAAYLGPLARLVGDGQPFVVLRDTTWETGASADAFEGLVNRFVDYIRSTQRQPLGPIGGHCFGGILAFECACRLEALGCGVPAVVLFDTKTPGYPKPLRHWRQYIKWAPRFASTLRPSTVLGAGRDVLAHVRYLGHKAAQSQSQSQSAGPTPSPSLWDVEAAIMHSYVPRPFGGKVINFIAAEEPVSTRVLEDAKLGWRDFARAGFRSHQVPGGHHSMFSEQHVAQLADLLCGMLAMPY